MLMMIIIIVQLGWMRQSLSFGRRHRLKYRTFLCVRRALARRHPDRVPVTFLSDWVPLIECW